MKCRIYILIFLAISCNNRQEKTSDSKIEATDSSVILKDKTNSSRNNICWIGNLNGKTPVFVHYQIDNNLVIGEITYLNTKGKAPIKLLGTIEEDKNYRLLEFGNDGNITGIITGTPTMDEFVGSWFSPKTRKELNMQLVPKDTTIGSKDIQPIFSEMFGDYHYQYSEAGYLGDFNLTKLNNDNVSFSILSVTGAPGRNIAEVPTDTIRLTSDLFIYKIPGNDSCEFKVKFYKDFLYINYTKGYCNGQFGNNATVDGLYLKIKK